MKKLDNENLNKRDGYLTIWFDDLFLRICGNKSQALINTTLLIAFIAVMGGGYWFTQRVAVGAARHALNHPDWGKDPFIQLSREACKNVNSGKVWIARDSPKYVRDRNASSADVYRYIVLDGKTLQDASCLNAFVAAASSARYSTSIVFVDERGKEMTNLFFYKEQK